ncbi:MAG: S41 family peptidase [Aggregatilineales bacterium]
MVKRLIAGLIFLALAGNIVLAQSPRIRGDNPEELINNIVDYLQKHAYFVDNVEDWDLLRQEALAMLPDDAVHDDIFPVIDVLLAALDDNHSHYYTISDLSGESTRYHYGMTLTDSGQVAYIVENRPADEAGLSVGDTVIAVNGEPITGDPLELLAIYRPSSQEAYQFTIVSAQDDREFTVTMTPDTGQYAPLPYGVIRGNTGYLELFALVDRVTIEPYNDAIQRFISESNRDDNLVCGWVIDLRRNEGGNTWTMLGSLGALFADEHLFSFQGRTFDTLVRHSSGTILFGSRRYYSNNFVHRQPDYSDVPVAILTSSITASAAEMTGIGLQGRAAITRSFGEATRGIPTKNRMIAINDGFGEDGGLIAMTEAASRDLDGNLYEDSIMPDVEIPIDWTTYNTPDDAVLNAAYEWLESEGCE